MNLRNKTLIFSIVSVLTISFICSPYTQAQETGKSSISDSNKTASSDENSKKDDITAKDITRWSILGGTIPVVYLFGLKSWEWGDRHKPYSKREGWFGEDTSFGGADKAGHFYAHYMVQRAVYNIFDWTEDGGSMKWPYSIGITMGVGLFIEIGDSYTSAYGFSYEDIVVDYSGILVGALLDYFPILDGLFGISIEYIPSSGYRSGYDKNERLKYALDIVNDYSGQQVMLNFKPAGFRNLGFDVPFALRILSIDAGFYTKGYTHYDTGRYPKGKERDIFIGISINSAQLLAEFWPDSYKGTAYKVTHTALEYYHLPYDRLPFQTRVVNDLNR